MAGRVVAVAIPACPYLGAMAPHTYFSSSSPHAFSIIMALEISGQSEIGIDDSFRIPSRRTIELALPGSSKNEAYSVKPRAKDLAKYLALCSRAAAYARDFLSLQRAAFFCLYDQIYGRPPLVRTHRLRPSSRR